MIGRYRALLLSVLVAALAAFYAAGATRHAEQVNVQKARGDQSGYLWDAERVYANWHGSSPPLLIGARNRMPLYAGFLAFFYRPTMTDPEYFVVGRIANIYLSLALLALLWLVLRRLLPPWPAANLIGVAAFGWYIFKAGYTQSELLFYTLFGLAFASVLPLFRTPAGPRLAYHAALAGALCGLAYLTKAALLPFMGILLGVGVAWALIPLVSAANDAPTPKVTSAWRLASLCLLSCAFFVVLWPYISTSKRAFGHYFYNVNSTFYVWYDDWPSASVGTRLHGDDEHWPTMPESELPGPARYWREHSVIQIAERLAGGFQNMWVVLWRDFDLLPYLSLYLGMLGVLIVTRRAALATLLREHRWESAFVALYLTAYLLATAFYHPTSGTGTGRFLLAHALPLFYLLSRVFASARFRQTSWQLGALTLRMRHFDALVSAVILANVAFRVWPRLMSTYGGF